MKLTCTTLSGGREKERKKERKKEVQNKREKGRIGIGFCFACLSTTSMLNIYYYYKERRVG
jgi:hypothetical protein